MSVTLALVLQYGIHVYFEISFDHLAHILKILTYLSIL